MMEERMLKNRTIGRTDIEVTELGFGARRWVRLARS